MSPSYKHPRPSRGLLLIPVWRDLTWAVYYNYLLHSCGSIRLSPHIVVRIYHCSYKCRPVTTIHGLLQGYYLSLYYDVKSHGLFIITIYSTAVALLDSHLTLLWGVITVAQLQASTTFYRAITYPCMTWYHVGCLLKLSILHSCGSIRGYCKKRPCGLWPCGLMALWP